MMHLPADTRGRYNYSEETTKAHRVNIKWTLNFMLDISHFLAVQYGQPEKAPFPYFLRLFKNFEEVKFISTAFIGK